MDSKRLFIAAPLPQIYQTIIRDFIANQETKYSWLSPEKWHLTLLFLGDFPEDSIKALKENLDNYFSSQQPIKITPKSFMFAPNLNKARMIWLRFHENSGFDRLVNNLYHKLANWYAEHSIDFNLRLHNRQIPHITLARFKPVNAASNRLFLSKKELIDDLPEMAIKTAILYESRLKPEGAIYHKLAAFNLNGEAGH